jgi:ribokinase
MSQVWVFGSINMDVVAFAPRHPKVGETVMGSELHLLPGGKGANQAVAARRAGADTLLVGRLGEDAFAAELRTFLSNEDINLDHTAPVGGVSTGTALIAVADADNTIVVVPGANARLAPEVVQATHIQAGDVVLAQFETPQDVTLAAFEKARALGATTILNPAPAAVPDAGLLAASDIVVLNETELAVLAQQGDAAAFAEPAEALRVAREIRQADDQVIVVTLGAAGAVAVTPDGNIEIAGREVTAVDTTGAGDCFVGNLAAALSRGSDLSAALAEANLAASICVQSVGAGVSMPTESMLRAAQAG